MKLINSLLIVLFLYTLAVNSSHAAQLDLNQLNELFKLAQKLQTNLTSLIKDEKFQEHARLALNKLLANVTSEDHKHFIEGLLPQLLSLNSTAQLQDVLKPVLKLFNLSNSVNIFSLIENSRSTFNELVSSSLVYASELLGSHDTAVYIQKSESFLKRVITKLLASKDVQEALKRVVLSAEKVFGKIDYANLIQQIQNGYGEVTKNPQVQEAVNKFISQMSELFFDDNKSANY